MGKTMNRTMNGLLMIMIGITLVAGALGYVSGADAATLKQQFRNEDGDLICVYDSHFHKKYINAGFSGYCSFSVPDSQLSNSPN